MSQKKNIYSFKNCLTAFVVTIMSSLAVIVSNGTYAASQQVKDSLSSRLATMIWQIRSSLIDIDYPLILLLLVAFVGFVYLIPKVNKKNIKWGIPFSLIAALFLLLCDSYAQTNSWDNVFGSTSALVTSGLKGIGIATLAFFAFDLVNRINIEQFKQNTCNNKKLFIIFTGTIFVCWIPYMVIMAPGAMAQDTTDQFAQITGNADLSWTISTIAREPGDILLNNHHPVFHTLLLGVFLKLGELIGSYFFAMELYCVIQCLLFACALSYSLVKLNQYGMSNRMSKIVLVFFALFPLFPLWGMATFKDTPFSIALLASTVLLYDICKYPKEFSKKKYFMLIVFLLLLMLIRNNGFYLILALLPFVIIHFRKDKKFLLKIVSVLLIPILVFKVGYSEIAFSIVGVNDGSPREMLSVPFQQTARYIKEYKDEITTEEEDAILTILGGHEKSLEDIAKAYTPALSDPVKKMYNKYAQTDDLINYFKVWAAQLAKHPDVYVEAFLNLTYSWFCFDAYRSIYYYSGINDEKIPQNFEGLDNPKSLNGEKTIVNQVVLGLTQIPLINCLFEFSFYTWIYVIAFIAMLIRKKYTELLICLPLFANYAINFLGPVAYMRYALPMVVCTPFVLFIAFSKKKSGANKFNEKKNSEDNEIWIK